MVDDPSDPLRSSLVNYVPPAPAPDPLLSEKLFYFIFLCGLTGSGKTALYEKTLRYLGIADDPASVVRISIDDLVEPDPGYVAEVRQIITDDSDKKEGFTEVEAESLCEYKKALVEPIFDAYTKARDPKYEEVNAQVREAISTNKHITYETTLSSLPKWIFTDATLRG